MKVKKNDTVYILTGKDAGKTGKVLEALPKDNRVKVEGVNIQKKSKKARSANETSTIIEQAGPINASNVMVVCPACGKGTRVKYQVNGDNKIRVCAKCGAPLDTDKKAKATAKAAKKTAKKNKADA